MSPDPAGSFIPPFPPRHATRPTLLQHLRRFRQSMLQVWMAAHFRSEFFGARVLRRHVFVCNSPETVRAAFVDRAEALHRKSPQQRHALAPLVGDGLIASDGAVWRERRRLVAPLTHTARIAAFAPVMTEVAEEWQARWSTLPEGAPLDVLEEMARMAAEIISRSVFGRRLGAQAAPVVEAFTAYQARVGQSALGAMLGLPDWVPQPQGLAARRAAWRVHRVLDALVADAQADAAGDTSLLGALAGMPARALRNEAATLFLAGHETTANTLAWAWYLLSQAPWAAQRVQAEAAAALGGRAAGFDDLPKLPYTRAVIDETLRLYPPIPVLAREASAPLDICGHAVPKGSLVLVVPWLLHRNPRLWDRPDHFQPERFLAGAPRRYSYLPFSIGPRVCTGQAFALAESVMCLATLAQGFRLALEPGHHVMPVSRLTLRPGAWLPMRLHRAAP
jgi:cytochrome P450